MNKAIGLLFKGQMVRAILDGSKTHTRRPITKLLGFGEISDLECRLSEDMKIRYDYDGYGWSFRDSKQRFITLTHAQLLECCPYGQAGGEMWVRETCFANEDDAGLDGVTYTADGTFIQIENTQQAADDWLKLHTYRNKRAAIVPSIHMPYWASRVKRGIVSVDVGKLLDVSNADALLEGMNKQSKLSRPVQQFRELIYQLYPHAGVNPWLWDIQFSTKESLE